MDARISKRDGIALVITIVMLAMLTLLVVGMATMMRLERQAAVNYDREVAAQQLAQAAVTRVIATLKATIPTTLDNNHYYMSMPGRVVGVDNSTGSSIITDGLLYSTGAPSTDLVNLNSDPASLRAPIISTTDDFYTLTGGGGTSAINAGWINVLNSAGTLGGRLAYWTDDDSCRVNLNAARYRSVPAAGGIINTSSIDLTDAGTSGGIGSFTTALSDAISGSTQKPFATPEHVKLVAGVTDSFYERNKFYFTSWGTGNYGVTDTGRGSFNFYNVGGNSITYWVPANFGTVTIGAVNFGIAKFGTEAELDIFGRPRLPFNSLTAMGAGSGASINNELYVRLSNTESIASGGTFTPQGTWSRVFPTVTNDFIAKYPMYMSASPSSTTTIPGSGGLQLMANLIDFTKSSGSNRTSATFSGSGSRQFLPVLYNTAGTESGLGYLGLGKNPYLNEIAVNAWGTVTTVGGTNTLMSGGISLGFELINPYEVGRGNGYVIRYDIVGTVTATTGSQFTITNTISTANILGDIPLHSYGVTSVVFRWDSPIIITGAATISSIKLSIQKVRLLRSGTDLRDYLALETFNAITPNASDASISFLPSGILPAPDPSLAFSVCKDDPRIPTIWKYCPSGSVTLGAQNSGAILSWATSPGGSLDWQEGGLVANHSKFYIQEGAVPSLGYLGFVHTGTPWRTLRLGAQGTNTAVPDWALLDIFKLGPDAYTIITPVTGRINVNQKLLDASGTATRRLAPMMAVLMLTNSGAWNQWDPVVPGTLTPLSTASLTNIANAIVGNPAAGSFSPIASGSFSVGGASPLAGAICEVAELVNTGTTDAQRESLIRAIAPLLTTRSRYFTVWSVGQSIKKVDTTSPTTFVPGVDIITGEARIQAVIERDPIRNSYRVVYLRYLTD